MSGSRSRRKGHDFERLVATRLAIVFGADKVRRGIQYRDGSESPDVVCPGFWIECKRGKRTNPRAALRQAIVDANGKPVWPVAVCRDDGEEATVTLRLDDFVELLTEWNARKSQ